MRKEKAEYIGISDDIKECLAIDIDKAGGLHNFDKGQKQALDKLLNNPDQKDANLHRGHPLRARIRSLVNVQWKSWSTEKYLKQVFIPLVTQQQHKKEGKSQRSVPPTPCRS